MPFTIGHKYNLGRKRKDMIGNTINCGREFTKERKEKMSKIAKERGFGKWMKYKDRDYFKKISLLGIQKQQNSKEPTSIEYIVYTFLKSKGIIFEKQKVINDRFIVDVYIPELNLIIECDGSYWHSLDRVMKKDKAENAYLKKCGFNLLRFSEEEIKSGRFIERMVV